MNGKHHFWLDELIGRESELDILFQHYQDVKTSQHPRMLCLLAESGVGKTRLVREFYQRLRLSEDKHGYWPATFSGDLITLDMNPDYSGHIINEPHSQHNAAFLWWAVRFSPDDARNRPIYSSCSLLRASPALLLHLNYQARNRLVSEDRKKTLDLMIDLIFEFGPKVVAEIAVPWLGLLGVGKAVVLKMYEASRLRREKKALDNALSSPDADLKQKVVDFQETLLTAMEAMVTATDQLSGMPIVIVLDDIHWADQESIVILQALLKKASEKRWPLLFLATVWPAPWAEAGFNASDTPLAKFRSTLRAVSESNTGSLHEISLARIDRAESIVNKGLPGLTALQRTALLKKFDSDLFALDLCVAHFRGRLRLFVDGDITKSLTTRGESELESFIHPRMDVIQKRFETLETEIQEILGYASYQGFRFIDELVIDVSRRLVDTTVISNKLDVSTALYRAENPACFIQHVSPSVAKFVDPANFQVVCRWLQDVPEDVESVRKATLNEIEAWIENGSLQSYSWTELDDFLSVARHVVMDAQTTAESRNYSEQLKRLHGELDVLQSIQTKKYHKLPKQGIGLTISEIESFAKYRGRLPLSWQTQWLVQWDPLYCRDHTERPIIEKLREIALILAEESTHWFIQNQTINNVDVIKDAWRAVVALTTSLFNFANIFDPAWENPDNEWDIQYQAKAINKYRDRSSAEVVSLLNRALNSFSIEGNSAVRIGRLHLLFEIERMTAAWNPRGNMEVSQKIFEELYCFPAIDLGRNEVLEKLFDGVLPAVMHGFSRFNKEGLKVISRLIQILKPLDQKSAGNFQLVTLAWACQLFGDRDLHLHEDSAPYFDKAFEMSLEIIRRDLPSLVLNWLDVSARVSCAATFRGNELRRWQAQGGRPVPDFLSRGWNMAQNTAARISEAAGGLKLDQLDAFHILIIGSMSRCYIWLNGPSIFEKFVADAKGFLGKEIREIRTICAYIWSLNAMNASINDSQNEWALLESAYRATFMVPPAFFASRGNYDQHFKCYESIKMRRSSAPTPDRLFQLTATACIELTEFSDERRPALFKQILCIAIANLIDASDTLVLPYKEWAKPVVNAFDSASLLLHDDESSWKAAFRNVQPAWKKYMTRVKSD